MEKTMMLIVVLSAFCVYEAYAIKCYVCTDGCLTKDAKEVECGLHIGPSQKAICTRDHKNEVQDPLVSVRRCIILSQNQKYDCPSQQGFVCAEPCTTDLCNSGTVVSLHTLAIIGLILSVLFSKFVLV